ncbi:hypothetical protein QR680_004310 [Steinernema hermaphroditum]|uniref:F-box domain-containing protein n=1 Tax=Steinernema hermaphroditum TaxID=289476 RepID=A0AA39HPC2_9BILA|nr:hypothetical protein QR680_004310 [Steinernema hermaphroditum]
MDLLPHRFFDSVLWYLDTQEVVNAKYLRRSVANVATHHLKQRRDLQLRICPHFNKNLCGIVLWYVEQDEDGDDYAVSLNDALSKYDRIARVDLIHSQMEKYEYFSFEDALTKVLPNLLSLSTDDFFWAFGARKPNCGSFYDDFFKLLGSHNFKRMHVQNYGDECAEFLRVQMQSPRLEGLTLKDDSWPDDFNSYYRRFMESPKCSSFVLNSMKTRLDLDLLFPFLRRWATGSVKTAKILGAFDFELGELVSFIEKLGSPLESKEEDASRRTFRIAGGPKLNVSFGGRGRSTKLNV